MDSPSSAGDWYTRKSKSLINVGCKMENNTS